MRRIFRQIISGIGAILLLSMGVFAAQFSDVDNHWAAGALNRAVERGILSGDPYGRLRPDDPVTGGEIAVMLCRVLNAQAEGSYPGAEGQWFTQQAGQAAALGMLPAGLDLNQPLSRGDAFVILSSAFQLNSALPDETALSHFSDMAQATPAVRRAAAAMVSRGVVQGTGSGLQPQGTLTRAEFVTLLDRLLSTAPAQNKVALLSNTEETAADALYTGDILITPPVSSARLTNTVFEGACTVRGDQMRTLQLDNVQGQRLTLAATRSDLALSSDTGSAFQTVCVGDGSGQTTLSGDITKAVEITGAGRTVSLSGMSLDSLVIAGPDCTLVTDANTSIVSVTVLPLGTHASIETNGTLGRVSLLGADGTVTGSGTADTVITRGKRCTVGISTQTLDAQEDLGLTGITLTLDTPVIQPGGELTASARISSGNTAKTCRAVWFVDGQPVYTEESATVADGAVLLFSQPLAFSYAMPLKHSVCVQITYENHVTGETEQICAQGDSIIENYPLAHYADEIISKITPIYNGPAADYTAEEKSIFVNAKGYTSPTDYLLWVSLSRQKVNVFTGKQGAWTLDQVFDCATGLPQTPTPVGVTYVTRKQAAWTFSSYVCRPVVRFYPNTGYAFHSRLYTPDSSGRLVDAAMSAPASHGCIRMMDDGINFLYKMVPLRTTVVIY